jgi:hypothetical protein
MVKINHGSVGCADVFLDALFYAVGNLSMRGLQL